LFAMHTTVPRLESLEQLFTTWAVGIVTGAGGDAPSTATATTPVVPSSHHPFGT